MNKDFSGWYQQLLADTSGLISLLINFIPTLLVSLAFLIIGYFVARILKATAIKLLKRLGVDRVSSAIGLNEHIQQAGEQYSAAKLIGALIFWIVFFIFVVMAADSLGLPQLSQTLDQFIIFIPKLIAAVLIVLIGFAMANIAKSFVYKTSKSVDIEYAKPLSQITFGIVAVLTVSLAFGSLDIDTYLLDTLVSVLVASVCFGAAISIGLGSKSTSENIMHYIRINEVLKIGDKVTLKQGVEANVAAIHTTVTLFSIEGSDDTLVIHNKEVMSGLVIHKKT